ncbi:MAG TPA: hypothetical protein VKS81_01550, partial [Bacteroidota bacterium]|nr:hypothetical protein [Bacteroidota bacterium]
MKKFTVVVPALLAIALFLSTAALAQVNVTFKVNMRDQITQGHFDPDSDFVTVRGTFNNWGSIAEDTMTYSGADSACTRTISMAGSQTISYKYYVTKGYWQTSNSGYELPSPSPNRSFTIGGSDVVIPTVLFDSIPTVNVTFQCNM